mgnify:CR=1 FL=1
MVAWRLLIQEPFDHAHDHRDHPDRKEGAIAGE